MSKGLSKQRQSWHCTLLGYKEDNCRIWTLQSAQLLSLSWETKPILICTNTQITGIIREMQGYSRPKGQDQGSWLREVDSIREADKVESAFPSLLQG